MNNPEQKILSRLDTSCLFNPKNLVRSSISYRRVRGSACVLCWSRRFRALYRHFCWHGGFPSPKKTDFNHHNIVGLAVTESR